MKCFPWLCSRKKHDVDGGASDSSENWKRKSNSDSYGLEGNQEARCLRFLEIARATENFREANLIGEGDSGKVYKGRFANGQEIAVKRLNSDDIPDNEEFIGLEGNQYDWSLAFVKLATATKNFREANLIGEGGSGKVYKGHFANGQEIAVKRLKSNGIPGNKEFKVEVLMLCLLQHPNLVKLIGYCAEGDERLVVYEYMPKGSLADHLYENSTVPVLDWNTRMKIAVGAAKGIKYLHCSADPPVIYRDLKSANILLDNEFNPRLSDFGIAKLAPVGDQTHVTTTEVMGTIGYFAPEYVMTGELTMKSDIFSFGVVLLELLTGRKACDPSKKQEEQSLVVWGRRYIQDMMISLEMVDARLEGRFPELDARRLIAVIASSLNEAPDPRPSISEIVNVLEDLAAQPSSSSSTSNAARPPRASSLSPSGSQQRLEGNQYDWSLAFVKLATATKNFREANLIGEGGSGKVYKGHFANGQEIAVKRLKSNGIPGNKEFKVEVLMLCLLQHPNLVKLIGYCAEGDERLVVYEYMPKGSLADHLYENSTVPVLDWNTRMKIAVGAAKGIKYLHCSADPPVIYRDLKSANILLDNEFNPRLSDFGIAKLAPVGDQTHVTTTEVMGTIGYFAPEYVMTGELTMKSDIFSFGVVLLELLTGRKACDPSKKQEEQSLVVWSHPFIRDMTRSLEMVDARLKRRFPERDARRLIAVIALSINEAPDVRPSISEIVNVLEYLAARPPRASSSSASGSQQRTNSAKRDASE